MNIIHLDPLMEFDTESIDLRHKRLLSVNFVGNLANSIFSENTFDYELLMVRSVLRKRNTLNNQILGILS